ncbi:MAG: LptF/LptG family permease [Lentisphaeria bacterium]|nr:LptF/LptG family permease [Lentisphaeria bacterium]
MKTPASAEKRIRRRWFPLWKLDGYIFREFIIKYSILLLVFVILFVLSDIYRDISDFFDAKASWRDIVTYLIYKTPGNIRFILPISMLLGCMWTMATFGKNLEVTAMRASGLSLFRCGWAILFVGLLVSGVNIYFNEQLVPETSSRAERLFDKAADKRRYSHSLLTYRSDDGKRRWLFQLFAGGNDYENITLKTFWDEHLLQQLLGGTAKNEKQTRTLQAVLGEKRFAELMALPPQKRQPHLKKLMEGRKMDFFVKRAAYDKKQKCWIFKSGSFLSYDSNDETRFKASSGTTAMHDEVTFENLTFTEKSIPESPQDIMNAIKEKDDLSTPVIWSILKRNPNMPQRARCIYETVFFYRIAFPWASFLAVFLGIPLAAKNERTGSMLAIISAIILIVIYIIVAQIFLMLGKSGSVDPLIAGLAPTIAFIIAGAWRLVSDRN